MTMHRGLRAALRRLIEATRAAEREQALGPIERRLERAMRRAFLAQGREMTRLLPRAGFEESLPFDFDSVWDAVVLATLKLFREPLEDAVRDALAAGALRAIGELGAGISFSLRNPRALAYIQLVGGDRITKINETTRGIIKGILENAMEEGWSYNQTAKEITSRFAEFAVGKPQRHIDSRAHLVAVTEAGNAYAEGNMQGVQGLADMGLRYEKRWITMGDDRVSDGCLENEGAGWIPFDAAFPSGDQRPLRFPGCRCDLEFERVKD